MQEFNPVSGGASGFAHSKKERRKLSAEVREKLILVSLLLLAVSGLIGSFVVLDYTFKRDSEVERQNHIKSVSDFYQTCLNVGNSEAFCKFEVYKKYRDKI